MNRRGLRGRGGFTRNELIVVILAILVVGGMILIPWINREIFSARATCMNCVGKQIYSILFGQENDSQLGLGGHALVTWPASKSASGGREFKSSSEFFAKLVESNVLDVAYGFFGGAGTGIKGAKDRTEFLDGTLRNAWCITLDVNDAMKSGAPVLFTQNFKFENRGPDTRIDQMVSLESDARPYGDRSGVVIMRGGAGINLTRETAIRTNFNPTGATNGFLWPLASGQDVSGR